MSGLDGIKIIQVPEFTRPTNVPYLIGDTSDFRNTTGWTPKRNLEEILTSIQNYWDQRVKNHPNL
jgi:GDP-D-mannose dehydratase